MSVKKKSLFDHIKQITSIQNPNYWNDISEDDKKTWSNYMVHRFLSMNMDWIELVNELQKYNLKPKELYKLYTNVIPKGKHWLKYIKGEKKMNYPNWLINILVNENQLSKKEAVDAIELYMLTEGGMAELGQLCRKWGVEESKIEENQNKTMENPEGLINEETIKYLKDRNKIFQILVVLHKIVVSFLYPLLFSYYYLFVLLFCQHYLDPFVEFLVDFLIYPFLLHKHLRLLFSLY